MVPNTIPERFGKYPTRILVLYQEILKLFQTKEFLQEILREFHQLQEHLRELLQEPLSSGTILERFWNHPWKTRNHPWSILVLSKKTVLELSMKDSGIFNSPEIFFSGWYKNTSETVPVFFWDSLRILLRWCRKSPLKDSGNIPQEFWYYIRRIQELF